jgi:membrane protein required for colicin V production
MMLEDWLIVIVLVLSVFGGLSQGFFRSVFSLGGLVIGLAVAAWNYGRIAALLAPFIKVDAIANAIGFIVIALVVMVIAGLIGTVLHKTFHKMGLGCLDRLAGAGFGFLQGVLLVTLCILVAVAFFPQAHWLVEARLPRLFFGACHLSTQMTPSDLAERVRRGLSLLEQDSPWWLHPGNGKP